MSKSFMLRRKPVVVPSIPRLVADLLPRIAMKPTEGLHRGALKYNSPRINCIFKKSFSSHTTLSLDAEQWPSAKYAWRPSRDSVLKID